MRYSQKVSDLTIVAEKDVYQGVSRCCEPDWLETLYFHSQLVLTDEFNNQFVLSLPISGQLNRVATDITKIHDEWIQELSNKQFLKRLLNKFR